MPTPRTSMLPPETERAMVNDLRAALRGEVIDRAHPAYDEARRVWNGLVDRRPAVMARCLDTSDVVQAIRIARQYRPTVSIRGGGHQVAGTAVCDNGLVLDLSRMKGISVDAERRTAIAQAGVLWGELDRATQAFGLATPGGEVSVTGIAGLTLGGGLGLIMRAHGLSCDNLRSLEIVTADGQVRVATREMHRDLWWAARGGGRGLGVVTSFEFDLHPLGPDVATTQVLYAYDDAERVLRGFRDLAPSMPDPVAPELVLWSVPPDPQIPEALHGEKIVFVLGVYAGPPQKGQAVLAPLATLATPVADLSGIAPYVAVQSSVDAVFPDHGRYYMKSHFTNALSDEGIRVLLDADSRRVTPESLIVVRTLGGAVDRVGPDDSAFAHRGARFNVSVDAAWVDPALDEAAIAWSRATWEALRPFSTGGVYLNFAGLEDEADAVRGAALGASVDRLDRIRRQYDPEGLFDAAARRL